MKARGDTPTQSGRGRSPRRRRAGLTAGPRRPALLLAFSLLALLALLAPPRASRAGEFPEHWHLVHFVARVAGYSPEDSRLIADASWAVDQNEDTLATGHLLAFAGYMNGMAAAGEDDQATVEQAVFDKRARTMTQGALLHSLSKNREAAAQLYESYIKSQGDAANARPDEATRKLRLILFGMYLHYVVDSFVHPDEAIPGHAPEEHQTDRIPNQPLEFTKAAVKSYRLLLDNQSFLAPQGLAGREALRKRYNLDNPMGQEGFFGNVVKAIAEAYATSPASTSMGTHILERLGRAGYPTDKLPFAEAGVPPADLVAVSNNLTIFWAQRVMREIPDAPAGADMFLGDQRRPANTGRPAFLTYNIDPDSGTFKISGHETEWPLQSFIQFVREDRDDGLNALREEMRAELSGQMRRTIERAKAVRRVVVPNRRVAAMVDAALNLVVVGSDSSAEKVGRSNWSPDAGVSPKFEPRKVVVEVARRGWATDGLEKYVKPAPPQGRTNELRVTVDDPSALARPEIREQIERAVTESARVTVIIETDRRTSAAAEQNEQLAKAIEEIARKQAAAHPEATRTLYVEGSGADVLAPILRREREGGGKIFGPPVVVQPIDPPASLPRDSTVVLTRSPFMNFDPGSPGYQRLKQSVRDYVRVASGVAVVESGGASPTARARAAQPPAKPPLEYYPKGSTDSTEPIRLTNSRLPDVLAPAGAARQEQVVRQIMRAENEHKPSTVGGISLVTPATLPVEGRSVAGASFDRNSNRIVLRSGNGRTWRLPPTDPELTRIAFDCLYARRVAPELSIGVNPDPNNLSPNVNVFYLSAIRGTHLGHIMFEADKLLGRLAFGGSDVPRDLGLSSLNLHTLAELYPDHYAETKDRKYSYGAGRVYLVPSRITLVEQSAGELRFDETSFDVRFEPSGPAEEEFVVSLVSNWEKILAAPGAGPFRELAEAARVVGVFNWLRQHDIPFDNSLEGITPRHVVTPTDYPSEPAPPLESLNPTLPLTQYGVNGVERIIDRDGKTTRLVYRQGRIAAVERKDGAVLNVYADDVGNLTAVAVGGSDLGAAFDRRDGRARFLDQVRLNFAGGKYVGFEPTPQTRPLYDVHPEDLVSTIVLNFIAEAHSPAELSGGGERRMKERGPVYVAVGLVSLVVVGGLALYLRARKRRVNST